MIFIKSNILKNSVAISLGPVVLITPEHFDNKATRNHELIHWIQCKEMLIIPFILVYLFFHFFGGYKENPFEKEAYWNENDLGYHLVRPFWAWLKFL